jgi:hypothetical protein
VGRAKFSRTPRSFGDIAVPAGFLHSPPVAQPALFGPSPILSRRSLHKLPPSLASAAPRTSSNSDVFVVGKHSRGEQKWTIFTVSTIAHTAMMDVWSKLAVARHGCLSVCSCGLLGLLCRRGFPTRSAFIATPVEFLAQTSSSKRRWGQVTTEGTAPTRTGTYYSCKLYGHCHYHGPRSTVDEDSADTEAIITNVSETMTPESHKETAECMAVGTAHAAV